MRAVRSQSSKTTSRDDLQPQRDDRENTEQDWLKTNLARFTRMLQGQRDPMTVSKMILSELAPLVNAEHGVFYSMVGPNGQPAQLAFQAGYAYRQRKSLPKSFHTLARAWSGNARSRSTASS